VRGQISAIFGGKKVELRQTPKPVTPFGGLVVFLEFLRKVGFAEQVQRAMPFELKSPNAIPAVETFTAFVVSVVVGARRFAQAGLVKADQALQAVLGLKRFPTDDTMRNLFKRFTQGAVYRFYSVLWVGSWSGWSPGVKAGAWTWTRWYLNATVNRKGHARGTIRESMGGRVIIRCWRF
jgi:hypothetical protein